MASQLNDERSHRTRRAIHLSLSGTHPTSHHYSLQVRTIMLSNCVFNLDRLQPPSESPSWLNYGLQVHPQKCSITASNVRKIIVLQVHISKLGESWSPTVSPNSVDYAVQVCMTISSKCISTLARSRSRSASVCSLDHRFQAYLQIRSITASKCIPN